MSKCTNLLHPLLYDKGTSQEDRKQGSPLQNPVKIDGRSLADLLYFLYQLSSHINYYDRTLYISDWQPFFEKSLPFKLAEISRYQIGELKDRLLHYKNIYNKRPTPAGLQLYIHYFFHAYINKIDGWYVLVKGNTLPLEPVMEKTIKEDLRSPLKKFLGLVHSTTNLFCIRKLNTLHLLENEVWGLDIRDVIHPYDRNGQHFSKEKQMSKALESIAEIVPVFENAIQLFTKEAEKNIYPSIFQKTPELKKNHPPHLGLLFSFLKLFEYLQADLNALTKTHLDYFYKDILNIEPSSASPDKAHLLFQIQKGLDKYLLKRGEEIKDGKDKNKAEIHFALDDEIVVNRTQVEAVKTVFLNHHIWNGHPWIEGVYMAPDARLADGQAIDFTQDPRHFPTLGSKFSKYADPETKAIVPYLNARLGFLLASPVLLLNEGTRKVTIDLHLQLQDICSQQQTATDSSNPCCEDKKEGNAKPAVNVEDDECNDQDEMDYLEVLWDFVENELAKKLGTNYYILTKEVLKEAIKLGLNRDLVAKLSSLLEEETRLCYCPEKIDKVSVTLTPREYVNKIKNREDRKILSEVMKPQRILNVHFSGEEEWLIPFCTSFEVSNIVKADRTFTLKIIADISPDQPAVTFYNGENLKEKLGIQLPSARVVLNDHVKILHNDLNFPAPDGNDCCLNREVEPTNLSYYQLFRELRILESSKIDVQVCGVKNLIVQNDENLQDVNRPISPFGPRPKIGSSFYIGSKELFFKNWKEYAISVEWKDKPENMSLTDHYKNYVDENDNPFITSDDEFKIDNFVLANGQWIPNDTNSKELFEWVDPGKIDLCTYPTLNRITDRYYYKSDDYQGYIYESKTLENNNLDPLSVNSRHGFARLVLNGTDFLHDRYAFVLARTLISLANIVDVYALSDVKDAIGVLKTNIDIVKPAIEYIVPYANNILNRIQSIDAKLSADPMGVPLGIRALLDQMISNINNAIGAVDLNAAVAAASGALTLWNTIDPILGQVGNANTVMDDSAQILSEINKIVDKLTIQNDIQGLMYEAKQKIDFVSDNIDGNKDFKGMPNEPYTPVIKSISIDYTATASSSDIELIHLYPFVGTYKKEGMSSQPTMFPTICEEGTLYLGLKDLVPGNNLNILFQLAEATADSELVKNTVQWHYLDNNIWKGLREGFEVLKENTNNLSDSGIVKFALPENMTLEHTVMPPKLHWIKASSTINTQAVAETLGIHTQAIESTFAINEANDTSRLNKPLEAEKLKKLRNEKAQITKVTQPYPSFGGRVPEQSGPYYIRVSERLRHKGRAIQKWDYERLLLERFPEIFTAKCINHSFGLNAHQYLNDFPMAPGYIVIAVIPDMKVLKAGNSSQPKVPTGLLEEMRSYILRKTSPFVRIKVMNPRYEKVNICVTARLLPGKDQNYYKEQLKKDLRQLLAPWTAGASHDISFGRSVSRSSIIGFLESRDYLDFILDIQMSLENKAPTPEQLELAPQTARSILIAGDIDVCIKQADCQDSDKDPCNHNPIQLVNYCDENLKL